MYSYVKKKVLGGIRESIQEGYLFIFSPCGNHALTIIIIITIIIMLICLIDYILIKISGVGVER